LELYERILKYLPKIKAVVVWGVAKIPERLIYDRRFMTFRAFMEIGSTVENSVIE
jgi:hypothetical protein